MYQSQHLETKLEELLEKQAELSVRINYLKNFTNTEDKSVYDILDFFDFSLSCHLNDIKAGRPFTATDSYYISETKTDLMLAFHNGRVSQLQFKILTTLPQEEVEQIFEDIEEMIETLVPFDYRIDKKIYNEHNSKAYSITASF